MSEINNNEPARVIGYTERRHPAVRQLARACIEIARQRLEKQAANGLSSVPENEPRVLDQGVTHA